MSESDERGHSSGETFRYVAARVFLVVGILTVLTTAVGFFRSYTPVPIEDEWIGVVPFYEDVKTGRWQAWIEPFYNHRIILPRLVFWIDYEYLNGQQSYMLAANYLVQCLTLTMVLAVIWRSGMPRDYTLAAAGASAALLLSWVQHENLIQSFQIQFFGLYCCALSAFLSFERAAHLHQNRYFWLALVAASAAPLNMANGILVFPILFVAALVLRAPRWQLITVAVAFAVNVAPYIWSFDTITTGTAEDGSRLAAIPSIVHFAFRFLGGPVYHALNTGFTREFVALLNEVLRVFGASFVLDAVQVVTILAELVGAGFFLLTAAIGLRVLKRGEFSNVEAVLIPLLMFIVASAFLVGFGRQNIGPRLALASRYTTPALVGWTAMLVLFLAASENRPRLRPPAWGIAAALVVALIVPQSSTVTTDFTDRIFGRNLAALSLKLGANDPDAHYHVVRLGKENLPRWAEPLIRREKGVYYKEWARLIGAVSLPPEVTPGESVSGATLQRAPIDESPYQRVSGWVSLPEGIADPALICLAHREKGVVGYALTGDRDRRPPADRTADRRSYWVGYLDAEIDAVTPYLVVDRSTVRPIRER